MEVWLTCDKDEDMIQVTYSQNVNHQVAIEVFLSILMQDSPAYQIRITNNTEVYVY